MKKTLGCIRRADRDWHMIAEGDRVAVGVSGGKDSMVLLYALSLYRRFSPRKFQLQAFTIKMGLEPFDVSPIAAFCQQIEVPYTPVETDIGKIVFDYRQEKNPCALCAKMRRGALHDAVVAAGCNKLALGHTMDDAIETFLLSLFYEGRLNTFSPKTYLSRKNITMIRPLVYLEEKHVIGAVNKYQLPLVKSPCPVNGYTKRQDMKELIKELTKTIPNVRQQMLSALVNYQRYNLWDRSHIEQESIAAEDNTIAGNTAQKEAENEP